MQVHQQVKMKKVICHPEVRSVIVETQTRLMSLAAKISEIEVEKNTLIEDMYKEIKLVHGHEIGDKIIYVNFDGGYFLVED